MVQRKELLNMLPSNLLNLVKLYGIFQLSLVFFSYFFYKSLCICFFIFALVLYVWLCVFVSMLFFFKVLSFFLSKKFIQRSHVFFVISFVRDGFDFKDTEKYFVKSKKKQTKKNSEHITIWDKKIKNTKK